MKRTNVFIHFVKMPDTVRLDEINIFYATDNLIAHLVADGSEASFEKVFEEAISLINSNCKGDSFEGYLYVQGDVFHSSLMAHAAFYSCWNEINFVIFTIDNDADSCKKNEVSVCINEKVLGP